MYADTAGAVEAAARFTDFVGAVDAHRNYGKLQIFGEQADARAKRLQFSVRSHVAFRKHEHTPPTVGQVPGKTKTFAEAGTFRQREDVKQRNDQKIIHAMEPAAQKKRFARFTVNVHRERRPAHLGETFAPHGDREPAPQPQRQRGQHKAHIEINHVVRDDQHRALYAAKISAAKHARVGQQMRRGPGQQVVDERANPGDGQTLRPAGKDKFGAFGG